MHLAQRGVLGTHFFTRGEVIMNSIRSGIPAQADSLLSELCMGINTLSQPSECGGKRESTLTYMPCMLLVSWWSSQREGRVSGGAWASLVSSGPWKAPHDLIPSRHPPALQSSSSVNLIPCM